MEHTRRHDNVEMRPTMQNLMQMLQMQQMHTHKSKSKNGPLKSNVQAGTLVAGRERQ
jgi:hypothetical protein